MKRYFGEIFEDWMAKCVEAIWLGTLKHGWGIADRIFKLLSWTLLAAGLEVIYKRTNIVGLRYILVFLLLVIFVGGLTSIVNGMIYLQDKTHSHTESRYSERKRAIINTIVTFLLMIVGIIICFPIFLLAFGQLLEAALK